MIETDVLVLGGGVAGLAAGMALGPLDGVAASASAPPNRYELDDTTIILPCFHRRHRPPPYEKGVCGSSRSEEQLSELL